MAGIKLRSRAPNNMAPGRRDGYGHNRASSYKRPRRRSPRGRYERGSSLGHDFLERARRSNCLCGFLMAETIPMSINCKLKLGSIPSVAGRKPGVHVDVFIALPGGL